MTYPLMCANVDQMCDKMWDDKKINEYLNYANATVHCKENFDAKFDLN